MTWWRKEKKSLKDPGYTNTLDPKWLAAIRERFADREDIGRERVFELYFAKEGLPKEEVFECFDLIETEYGYIAGLLRPEDSLDKLFDPVPTRNPFCWAGYRIMAGDRQLWFGEELYKRMRERGTFPYRKLLRNESIDDFIRAWCGRIPRQEKPPSTHQANPNLP
jgi:hypothetical protein